MSKNCCTHQVWTVPFFPESLQETLWMGQNFTQQPKNYSFSLSEKSLWRDLNLSLSKVSFLPHQIAIFKQSPYAIFICSCSHFCCIIIFSISGFMYTHVMLIWLTNVYWMMPLAWRKHWIVEALPSKISNPSTFPFPPSLQCYFENPASINACFPLFCTPFVNPNFIKFQLIPLQLGFCGLWANQI